MLLEIRGRRIGPTEPLFAVAEIGLNHGGSLNRALALVDAAAQASASAVKVQIIEADRLVAPHCPPPAHVAAQSLRDFFRQFELDDTAYRALSDRAHKWNMAFLATPFSVEAVDRLERAGVDAYKIASGDLTFDQLIDRCARTGKPLVVSTGLATVGEIAHAIACARLAGATQIALLHCVSAYPVPEGSENVRALSTLRDAFGLAVGLSDHASDTYSIPIAVALGASIYERHLMLLGDDDTVDAAVSSDPHQFQLAVQMAARARAALGNGRKECSLAESMNQVASRRALHAARDLRPRHVITEDDVIVVRPGNGLAPSELIQLVGVELMRDVSEGEPFLEIDLDVMVRRRAVA